MAVLVVDDASIMRVVLKDILARNCGFDKADIFEASGGNEAISQYKKITPELVFCDISMPDMNGLDVVKTLITLDPAAKIIMCTASGAEDDIKECIKVGAIDYIVKPPKVERIVQAVAKIKGEHWRDEKDSDEKDSVVSENEDDFQEDTNAPPKSDEDLQEEVKALHDEIDALKKEIELLKAAP